MGEHSCPLLPPPHAAGLAHLPGLSAAHSSSFWVGTMPRAPNHTQASPATRVELSIPSQPHTCTEMPGSRRAAREGSIPTHLVQKQEYINNSKIKQNKINFFFFFFFFFLQGTWGGALEHVPERRERVVGLSLTSCRGLFQTSCLGSEHVVFCTL